jgi:hypothetical protein
MSFVRKIGKYDFFAILVSFCFLVLCLLTISSFEIGDYKKVAYSATIDEVPHISSGYYYLTENKMFLNPEHPPLAKVIPAFPLLFLDLEAPDISERIEGDGKYGDFNEFYKSAELANNQWKWGELFIYHPQNNPVEIVFWARFGTVFANTILLLVLYFTLKLNFRVKVGLVSIFIIAFSTFFLGHATLANTDVISALLQIIALIWFGGLMQNLAKQDKLRIRKFLIVTAISTALALLSKFNSIILLSVFGLIALIYIFKDRKFFWLITRNMVYLISLSYMIVILFYLPFTFKMTGEDLVYQWENYYSDYANALPAFINGILYFLMESNPITRAIYIYFQGFALVLRRLAVARQQLFFMGDFYGGEGAGPLYFPVLYLTKTPISFLLLAFGLILLAIMKNLSSLRLLLKNLFSNPILLSVLIFILVYLITSIGTRLQIGLRHIMPFILAFNVLISFLIYKYWNLELFHKIRLKSFFGIFALIYLLGSFMAFPNYLSHYNYLPSLFGKKGSDIATDSNFDWGQDMAKLKIWLEENNIEKFYGHLQTSANVKYYFDDKYKKFNLATDDLPESGSYIVVSDFAYKNNLANPEIPNEKKYSNLEYEEYSVIGETIYVFKL